MAEVRPANPPRLRSARGALVGAAALAAAAGLIETWEGTRLSPYRDLAGVWTVCTGETRVPMRRYTRTECDALLREAIASDYGRGVLAAAPMLERRPHALAASISLAYNIGVLAFAHSSVARRFNAGDWRGGCDAFLAWRFVRGREVAGLVRRRAAERQLCRKDM